MASIPRLENTSSERFKVPATKGNGGMKRPGRKQSLRIPDRRPRFPCRQDTESTISAGSCTVSTAEDNQRPKMTRASGGINLFR
jgi:hypothetical protein